MSMLFLFNILAGWRHSPTATSSSMPTSCPGFFPESETLRARRAEAIRRLGEKWILHPNYTFHPRHASAPDTWYQHRTLK